MKCFWLLALLSLAGCAQQPSHVGVYKQGVDVPAGLAPLTIGQGLIEVELKADGTYRMSDKTAYTESWSGRYTVQGQDIWFVMPNGVRRHGRFKGSDMVLDWNQFG